MARKSQQKLDELPPIAAALRQIASKMEAEVPQPEKTKAWDEQEERHWHNRCEAARLLLAATEAGAFADDAHLQRLIAQSKEETDRDTVGDWREHLKDFHYNLSGAIVEEWMPARWPDCIVGNAKGPEANIYGEEPWYSANFRILADKIEAVWAMSQPAAALQAGHGPAPKDETQPTKDNSSAAAAESPKRVELPKTMGALLAEVEGKEDAYRQNIAVAERYEAKGSPMGRWFRTQAEISRFHPVSGYDPTGGWRWSDGAPINTTLDRWPGIDMLEAICQAEFGSGVTGENLRRIRGRLVVSGKMPPSAVDGMSIQQVVDKVQGMPTPAQPSQPVSTSASIPGNSHPDPQTDGYELFYSFSTKDEALCEQLMKHLTMLKRENWIREWHFRKIPPGTAFKEKIDEHLNTASIILLLISADFLASEYCWDIEMKRAIERHRQGSAVVIPVVLRECDWHSATFSGLEALPKDAKPVTSWADQDQAFTDIAKGIRRTINDLRRKQGLPPLPEAQKDSRKRSGIFPKPPGF